MPGNRTYLWFKTRLDQWLRAGPGLGKMVLRGNLRRYIYAVAVIALLAGLGWGFGSAYRRMHGITMRGVTQNAQDRAQEVQARQFAGRELQHQESRSEGPGGQGGRVQGSMDQAVGEQAQGNQGTAGEARDQAHSVAPVERPVMPVHGRITCSFGWARHPVYGDWRFHPGLDIEVAEGTPVRASLTGRVIQAGKVGDYGLSVTIEHDGGKSTFYGHLDSISVEPGQVVKQGAVIGRSGDTGAVKVPHVHYEIRQDGEPVDPGQAMEVTHATQ
ncbi:MAG TPA: M23 family metallopeptidase [Firmicutes bacterium]|nr:M23 family metallopeptidase [Bacillota bacterium]